MGKLYYILTLLAITSPFLSGQNVAITAEFDTTSIYIGDQVGYTVTLEQPNSLKLTLPQLKDTICDKVEILSGPFTDTSLLDGDRLRIISRYIVTSFDSGYYTSHPVYSELNDATGIRRFYSGYSRLEVTRVNVAPADTAASYYDVIEPYKAPVTVDEVIPWVLYALLAALVVYGIYKLIYFIAKRNLKKEDKEVIVPKEPAHIIAFRELDLLQEAQLWQKGEIKGYYTRLTEIVRKYLDNRYGISSMELTTGETLDALRKVGFKKDDNYAKLKRILDGSDLVKFAKHKPQNDEHGGYFVDTKKFVEDTMEKTVETVGPNNVQEVVVGNNKKSVVEQMKKEVKP